MSLYPALYERYPGSRLSCLLMWLRGDCRWLLRTVNRRPRHGPWLTIYALLSIVETVEHIASRSWREYPMTDPQRPAGQAICRITANVLRLRRWCAAQTNARKRAA